MAITPQAIKDQEFQSKFRGYDTIEVKAYLELVAEEFFELLEQVRQQEERIAELERDKELEDEIKKSLEDDIEAAQRTVDDLRSQLAGKEEADAELAKEIEELQTALDDFDQERKDFEEEISETEERVSVVEEKLNERRAEIDSLQNKIKLLEEQNQELRKEEIDFKRTIGVAQRFADDLQERTRKETEALRRESEARASLALKTARDEIERLRQDAYAELSRLPEEIERLSRQKKRVREDLREILNKHIEELETFPDSDEVIRHYEYSELFEKINIPEVEELTETLHVEDAEETAEYAEEEAAEPEALEDSEMIAALEEEQEERDELDDISMELPILEDIEVDQEEDDLRNKLAEGGVAYLSDD